MISDKYAAVRTIAVTEHTSVFLVRHIQLDTLRVAKVVSRDVPDYRRVYNEAMLIKDLKYDGLPIIYDIEEDDISITIIEEYIAGKSLEEYLKESGTLPVDDAVDIAVAICNIVEYLHRQAAIAHLDIKPANIIITYEERRPTVHLIDFDSSRRDGSAGEWFYGTAGFAAPEQYFGGGGTSSDIYSIGVLIAYMIGFNSRQSDSDDSIHNHHFDSIEPVINRCIRHNQNQRYQSIEQLRHDLMRIQKRRMRLNEKCTDSAHGKGISRLLHLAERAGCKHHFSSDYYSKDGTVNVYVAGTRHGIGTTHLTLCMASFLAKRGYVAAVVRHGDNEDLKSDKVLKYLHNGVITHGGVVIRPEYSGCVRDSFDRCTYRIHDCGTDYKVRRHGLNILVGDCGYRRSDYRTMEQSDGNTIIFINHVSGREFYRYCRTVAADRRCYRFPCMYRWDESSRLFEEAMLEIFQLPKGKARASWR